MPPPAPKAAGNKKPVAGSKAGAKAGNAKAAVAPVAAAPTGPNGAPLYSAAKLLALLHGNKPAEPIAPAPPAVQVSATSIGGSQHATSLPSHREHSHQQESIYAASPSPYPQHHQAYAQPNPQYPPQQQFNHQQPPQYFQQPPAAAPSPYPTQQNPYYAGHAGPVPPAPLNIPSYYPPSSADHARRGLSSAPSSDAPPNLHSMDKLSKQQQLQADLAKQIEEKRQLKLKEQEKEARAMARDAEISRNFNPFGRNGCGAPFRDADGHIITNRKAAVEHALANSPTNGGRVSQAGGGGHFDFYPSRPPGSANVDPRQQLWPEHAQQVNQYRQNYEAPPPGPPLGDVAHVKVMQPAGGKSSIQLGYQAPPAGQTSPSGAFGRFQFSHADPSIQDAMREKQIKQQQMREILDAQAEEQRRARDARLAGDRAAEAELEAKIARQTGRPPPIDYAPLKPEAMTPRRMAVQESALMAGRRRFAGEGGGALDMMAPPIQAPTQTSPVAAALQNSLVDHRKRALHSNPFIGDSQQDQAQKRNLEKQLILEQIAERKRLKDEAQAKEREEEARIEAKLARERAEMQYRYQRDQALARGEAPPPPPPELSRDAPAVIAGSGPTSPMKGKKAVAPLVVAPAAPAYSAAEYAQGAASSDAESESVFAIGKKGSATKAAKSKKSSKYADDSEESESSSRHKPRHRESKHRHSKYSDDSEDSDDARRSKHRKSVERRRRHDSSDEDSEAESKSRNKGRRRSDSPDDAESKRVQQLASQVAALLEQQERMRNELLAVRGGAKSAAAVRPHPQRVGAASAGARPRIPVAPSTKPPKPMEPEAPPPGSIAAKLAAAAKRRGNVPAFGSSSSRINDKGTAPGQLAAAAAKRRAAVVQSQQKGQYFDEADEEPMARSTSAPPRRGDAKQIQSPSKGGARGAGRSVSVVGGAPTAAAGRRQGQVVNYGRAHDDDFEPRDEVVRLSGGRRALLPKSHSARPTRQMQVDEDDDEPELGSVPPKGRRMWSAGATRLMSPEVNGSSEFLYPQDDDAPASARYGRPARAPFSDDEEVMQSAQKPYRAPQPARSVSPPIQSSYTRGGRASRSRFEIGGPDDDPNAFM